jgi:hypothetical protein
MSHLKISYRNIQKYKYQLMMDYKDKIAIKNLQQNISTKFIDLTTDGDLTIRNHYAWDGPSGPTIDTKTFMRGSLVHDALYQLMRLEHLDYKVHRDFADDLLKEVCLHDGMFWLRAWYVQKAVHLFAKKHAMPPERQPNRPTYAP